MASQCDTCGRNFGLADRARGRTRCDSCTAAAAAALQHSLVDYSGMLEAVIRSGGQDANATSRLRATEQAILASGGQFAAEKDRYFRSYLDHLLVDERLSLGEEQVFERVGDALYGPEQQVAQVAALKSYRSALFIAMINDGRLPDLGSGGMNLKRGERLHLQEPAGLLKEIIQREFQSGSRGYSFQIAKGVSYRIGSTRGKMVEVGRSMETIDNGDLYVTSLRVVFTGLRKSVEVPYAKLLDLNVFTDGIQFHVSGRQTPSMFRVTDGQMTAAVVNAAMQATL